MKINAFAGLTDEQLVSACRTDRRTEVFGELYSRYHQKLYQYCLSICRDREDAYDLSQESFVRAAEKIDRLRNPSLFASWLFRIAHNCCIDCGKGRKRLRFVPTDYQHDPAEEEFDMERAQVREKLYEQMDDLLGEVSTEARDMLLAKYCEKASIRDLQQRYGLSESAVKMRLARARKRMQTIIDTNHALTA